MESDAQLIHLAADDPDAFRQLYDRYAHRLHRFFARRAGDEDVALDLTAETFAQAWVSRRRFRDRAAGSAAPWLFAIARHVLLASVATRRVERTMLERLQVDWRAPTTEPEPSERWLEGLDADLEEALGALPAPQRQALELRVLDDLGYAELAERVGCSSVAARIRVSRGLANLRARLEGGQG